LVDLSMWSQPQVEPTFQPTNASVIISSPPQFGEQLTPIEPPPKSFRTRRQQQNNNNNNIVLPSKQSKIRTSGLSQKRKREVTNSLNDSSR
jgi:hypothetical protein